MLPNDLPPWAMVHDPASSSISILWCFIRRAQKWTSRSGAGESREDALVIQRIIDANRASAGASVPVH